VSSGDGAGSAAATDALIVPALELAVIVARLSGQVRPPVPVPRGIRSLTRFTRLPASARPVVRKVLEEDEEFRGRVAVAADQIEIPRGAWLYLHRPEGWAEELASLAEAAAGADAEAEAGRADRALQRRLAGAEDRMARLDEALLLARAEVTRAADELAGERKARREAEARAAGLARKATSLEGERDHARAEVETLAARVAELESMATGAARSADDAAAALALAARERDEARTRAAAADASVASASRSSARVSAAVSEGAMAAAALAAALGRAADALRADADAPAPPGPGSDESPGSPGGERGTRGPSRPLPARRTKGRQRTPHPLPPAVFDDSREAAEHLVRVPNMLVLVDGYNVTLARWHDLPIAAQRARLIDACAELAARSGSELMIVFDGAEEPDDLTRSSGRPGVRWRFSPAGVDADDVLLGLVGDVDPGRPVVVASSDRRVRDGARRLGANAISTPQLLTALRREPR
jgi:predicted RNA-binding protein with PIN domain